MSGDVLMVVANLLALLVAILAWRDPVWDGWDRAFVVLWLPLPSIVAVGFTNLEGSDNGAYACVVVTLLTVLAATKGRPALLMDMAWADEIEGSGPSAHLEYRAAVLQRRFVVALVPMVIGVLWNLR